MSLLYYTCSVLFVADGRDLNAQISTDLCLSLCLSFCLSGQFFYSYHGFAGNAKVSMVILKIAPTGFFRQSAVPDAQLCRSTEV